MQRHRVVIAAIVNLSLCLAVFGQVERPGGRVRTTRPPIVAQPGNGNVVTYAQRNFSGQSMVLAAGDNRLTDLKPASIRVPAGLVAYLYEHVDSAGGYGILVDLMEDHANLAEFGLSGNVSMITVFPSTRQGLVWARNSMSNGQFVAGHWERVRVGGNPVNTVAVASPPVPSRAPAAPTSIQQQGTRWTITTLGPQSAGDAARWSSADPTMGVIGSDFRGPQEIGSAAFERASNNIAIPDWFNFWYPNKQRNDHRSMVYFKRTLTGVIMDKITKNWSFQVPEIGGGVRTISGDYDLSDVPHVSNISGTYQDFDLNIDVEPFADYMYLIRDSHLPARSTEKRMKDLVDSDHDPCTDPFFVVEAEIDSSDVIKQKLATLLRDRIGKQVAMYGPWIYDIGHCDHPEIHPAEQIWWTEYAPNKAPVYHLNVFADASKRFLWRSQMDDGTKLHPWGAPPITGLFAIAFEFPMSTTHTDLTEQRFEVANVDFWNVVPISSVDKVYELVYGGKTIVSFAPSGDVFKVSYENVGLKPGTTNIVRGFLVIETTVGTVKQIATKGRYLSGNQLVTVNVPQGADPDKIDQRIEQQIFQKEPGHYAFTVTRRDVSVRLPLRER
jgi:hypothetical protein